MQRWLILELLRPGPLTSERIPPMWPLQELVDPIFAHIRRRAGYRALLTLVGLSAGAAAAPEGGKRQ